jgi:hypothetical protein
VGVSDRFGDGPQQGQPLVDVELAGVLGEKVVQPRQLCVVRENQRRAEVVLDEVGRGGDAGMLDPTQGHVLAVRGTGEVLGLLRAVGPVAQVDAHPPPVFSKPLMGGDEILPPRTLLKRSGLEPERADRAAAGTGFKADLLLDRLAQRHRPGGLVV